MSDPELQPCGEPHIQRHDFASSEDLATRLAAAVANRLEAGIAARGSATLAVSGGTTPVRFFEALSVRNIDWPSVTVTLVDERFVPSDHDRSNERLVRRHLLRERAVRATFLGLWRDCENVEMAAAQAARDIARLSTPLDVVVLGMGTDGHTASYFADAPNFGLLTSPVCPKPVLPVEASSAGEPRLTLCLPLIAQARFLALHVEGQDKQTVLERALNGAPARELPIRAVLDHAVNPIQVYWAP